MPFLALYLLFKIVPFFVCSSCHYLNYLKKLQFISLALQLPYLRWKRFAVVAALCILAVRAVIVQLAFFLHIQASLPVVSLKFSCGLFFETQMITAANGLGCLFPESYPNSLSIIYQTFVFRRPAMFSRPLIFATGFMTFFSVVIALFKVIANRMFCLL